MVDREFYDELQDEYEDVFEEGREARKKGLGIEDNPYSKNTFASTWILGWTDQDQIFNGEESDESS